MPNEYTIKTVQDFLTIPEDRLSDCIKEFEESIKMAHAFKNIQTAIDKNAPFDWPYFKWIDDGKKAVHLKIKRK